MTPLDQKILIPRPTKCETVGNPLVAVALYRTHVLGLSQVAWPTFYPSKYSTPRGVPDLTYNYKLLHQIIFILFVIFKKIQNVVQDSLYVKLYINVYLYHGIVIDCFRLEETRDPQVLRLILDFITLLSTRYPLK